MTRTCHSPLVLVAAIAFLTLSVRAKSADTSFFENQIRPVLVEHCFKCHSAKAERIKGGLLLDSRRGLLRGGDSGPAIVPGEPDSSLLLSALKQDKFEMPPNGRLPDPIIAAFEKWVGSGAPTPASFNETSSSIDAPSNDIVHWAFEPPVRPQIPAVIDFDWVQNPIDSFILAKLEQDHIRPSSKESSAALIRRASFDTTGLPPVEGRRSKQDSGSYRAQIEQFLASPRYGEFWGRKWLDLARYADTNGVDENYNYLNAWRYRDYVVKSLNVDKPYDQFLTEQIAGDLLPVKPALEQQADQITATGFLTLGPKMLAEQDKDKLLIDIVDEQIDVLSKTTMALTVGCARCHDHKFDPISSEDYYALAGIFASTKTMANTNHVSYWTETVLPSPDNDDLIAAYEQLVQTKQAEFEAVSQTADNDEKEATLKRLKKELAQLTKRGPAVPKAMAVVEGKAHDLPIHIRGSHLNLGDQEIPRGFLQHILKSMAPGPHPEHASGRLELARWLTASDHPLTARVMVNRIWQGYFGRGLVDSPSNFGLRGATPSHPALLDWLATELIAAKWSLKHIHRLILTSATYQQSSEYREPPSQDPGNRLLWRQNQRRLPVESLRDTLLLVANRLDLTIGGRIPEADANATYYRGNGQEFESPRRALYLPIIRGRGYELFNTFDYADSVSHLAQRTVTTVPHQALFMLNSRLVSDTAEALAEELHEQSDDNGKHHIEALYRRLYSRAPSAVECDAALEFLSRLEHGIAGNPDRTALGLLVQSLIAANEFIYVD